MTPHRREQLARVAAKDSPWRRRRASPPLWQAMLFLGLVIASGIGQWIGL